MAGNNAQDLANWTPTPKQFDLLNALRKPALKRSITSLCKSADVSRESFYKWRAEDPGFRAAWARAWEELLETHWPAITGAIVKQALAGEAAQQRLAAEMRGVLKQRVEHSGPNGGPIRTVDMAALTPEQLDALISLAPVEAGIAPPSRPVDAPASSAGPDPGDAT